MSIWGRIIGGATSFALGGPLGGILGVSREDEDTTIRKEWIKLNKEHHPDNLMAKGMPKEFINRANDELASINLAYDKIKEMREIN